MPKTIFHLLFAVPDVWVHAYNNRVPPIPSNIVKIEGSGHTDAFIIRVTKDDGVWPGYAFEISEGVIMVNAVIANKGLYEENGYTIEQGVIECDFLVDDVSDSAHFGWFPFSGRVVPSEAVVGGQDNLGNSLYIISCISKHDSRAYSGSFNQALNEIYIIDSDGGSLMSQDNDDCLIMVQNTEANKGK